MNNDFAVLVLSCDKYNDTWEPFFTSFRRFTKFSSNKIYLVSNNMEYDGYGDIKTIKTGIEISWSSKIRKTIEEIKESYVLVLLDDYFIVEEVNMLEIFKLFDFVVNNNIDYLSLVPMRKKRALNKDVGLITNKNLYGKTLQPAFWNLRYFKKCLYDDDFSAWEFENRQKFESQDRIKGKDCCTYTKKIKFVNGVLQGRWYPSAVKKMKEIDIIFSTENRGMLCLRKVLIYKLKIIVAKITPVYMIRKSKRIFERLGIKFVTKTQHYTNKKR